MLIITSKLTSRLLIFFIALGLMFPLSVLAGDTNTTSQEDLLNVGKTVVKTLKDTTTPTTCQKKQSEDKQDDPEPKEGEEEVLPACQRACTVTEGTDLTSRIQSVKYELFTFDQNTGNYTRSEHEEFENLDDMEKHSQYLQTAIDGGFLSVTMTNNLKNIKKGFDLMREESVTEYTHTTECEADNCFCDTTGVESTEEHQIINNVVKVHMLDGMIPRVNSFEPEAPLVGNERIIIVGEFTVAGDFEVTEGQCKKKP